MKRIVFAIWACAVASAGGAVAAHEAGIRWNTTPSVPMGLWRLSPTPAELGRGEVVGMCPPDTPVFRAARAAGYIGRGACPGDYELLLKPVAALPGDKVTLDRTGVVVNGRPLPNTVPLQHDGRGRALPQMPHGTYTVPAGFVWLVSSWNVRSFDARYFGTVPLASIRGVARPLWISPP